jgi:hypothetical protein
MSNQRGFTLIQVLTGVAMMAIVGLVVAGVFTWLNNEFLATTDRLKTETLAAEAEARLRGYLSQAVYMQFTGNPGGNLGAGPGQFRGEIGANQQRILYDQMGDIPAPGWRTIAIFNREGNVGDNAMPAQWRAVQKRTAIFYRSPTATTSGVLFIDDGSQAGAMAPGFNDQFFDRIVLLDITKNRHPTFDRIISLDVKMRFRYHSPGANRVWCPSLDINNGVAGCTARSFFHDIETSFNILLRNNLLRDSTMVNLASSVGQNEERVLGSLYFFQPYLPMR